MLICLSFYIVFFYLTDLFDNLGDELLNSAFKVKVVEEFIWEVDGKVIQVKDGVDEIMIGANPSAEGGCQDFEDNVQTTIDVAHASRLIQSPFNKKAYKDWIKDYFKLIKERVAEEHPDKLEQFKTVIQKYWAENILKSFDQWEFYCAENFEAECQYVIPCNYREDGVTPYFVFIGLGLDIEKY